MVVLETQKMIIWQSHVGVFWCSVGGVSSMLRQQL